MATTKAERRRTVMNTTTFDPSLLEQPPAPPTTSTNTSANVPIHASASANTSKPSSRSSTQTQRQVSGGPSHSQKTLDQILANACPPGDMQNALSQLLDERNAVVQQNTQLWRIIEKQKASLAAAAKDLERIRAEREKYRRLFEETSGSGSEGRSRTVSKNRAPMARHQSDDVVHQAPSRSHGSRSDLNGHDEHMQVSDDRDTTLTPATRPPARSESLPASTASSKLSVTSATEDPPPPAASSSLEPPTEPTSRAAKRESRIDFPDQTRQYIANMQSQNENENPPSDPTPPTHFAPPPLPNVASVSPMNFDGAFAQHMVQSQPQPQDTTKTPTQSSVTGFVAPPPPPPLPSRVPAESDEEFSADGHSSTVYSPAESNSKQALPTIIRNAPSIPQLNKHANAASIQTASLYSSMQEDTASFDGSPIATSPTTSTMSTPPPPPKMQRTDSQQTTTTTSPPRLTPFDMGTAIITVPLSHIRANDRGKEVLSFVIEIALDPMSEREGWKIEKLYSDVLALDVKVRQTLSRSALKKIAPLPDAKLFKDNAPAKVDQRKMMLQAYLSTVLAAPWKNPADVTPFFTSDVILHARAPVSHPGYKEGYLTKRGKNFGGWKTRYFVLQSPVLEYYESRGGAHLGSIPLVGSQIGRQQRQNTRDNDDENAYRHAFLIIEGKRGPSGALNRHVLCAESDEERDAWVEVLVRYVVGEYDAAPTQGQGQLGNRSSQSQSRASTSSFQEQQQPRRTRAMSKDEILKGNALPISQLAQDASNAKLFQAPPPPPELGPKVGAAPIPIENRNTANTADQDAPLSSSLPSQLDVMMGQSQQPGQRSNSELGHYPDMVPPPMRKLNRASYHPSAQQHQERAPSPDKVKISGPMNGAPIPAGHRFRDSSAGTSANNERERKAKSGRFWGFGKATSDKPLPAPQIAPASRAVFGIPLQESLTIAQIANLPAIVFRCIEYLEAKRADQEEGIYRLSGSSAVIKSLKDKFNAEGDVNLLESEDYWDPHAVAGLLKSYLRELPSSILTRDLHLNFLAVIDLADPQERVSELASLISQLPLANYSLLRALTAHLILIVQNSNVNKMTMRNVGIVFSPTLGIPAGVFSLMLNEFNRVFSVEAEGASAPVEEAGLTVPPAPEATLSARGKRGASDPSRRNSRSYNEAHADKLLGLAGRTLKVDEESDEDEGALEDNDHESEDETDHSGMFTTSPPQTPAAPAIGAARLEPPPTDPHKGHSATVAASRGLHIAPPSIHPRSVSGPGLPQSPRPVRSPAGSTGSPATPRT
ncbi:unnamed protein product [Rhizoctonia solani]|uniref:RhoGAP-domain-containing protein n=1 Tax=Rhizoctonia solani TaxID=456999 RepID=A0A8H2XAS1_9AGAM|nr:unnamed protein product [Rhizoctonia solani]